MLSPVVGAPSEVGEYDRALAAVVERELVEKLPGATKDEIDVAVGRVVRRTRTRTGMAMLARMTVDQIRRVRELQESGQRRDASELIADAVPDADEVLKHVIELEVDSEVEWLTRDEG